MESSSLHIKDILDFRESNDFLKKYQNINNKLKKRFMRNPNITEASEQFIQLANQCEKEEVLHYAGLCYLAVSRCYHTLGNITSEINYLIKAGKLFIRVDEQNTTVGCPSIGLENVLAASSCFSHATVLCEKVPEFKAITAGSIVKLALVMGTVPASGHLLRKSVGIFSTVMTIDRLVLYCIKQDDYTNALSAITEMIDLLQAIPSLPGHYRQFLRKAEINRLFLILMLHRTSQQSSVFSEILEKYSVTEDCWNTGISFSEDEFCLLQSLVLACSSQDGEALLELEGQFWKYLDADQKDLLRTLVRVIINE